MSLSTSTARFIWFFYKLLTRLEKKTRFYYYNEIIEINFQVQLNFTFFLFSFPKIWYEKLQREMNYKKKKKREESSVFIIIIIIIFFLLFKRFFINIINDYNMPNVANLALYNPGSYIVRSCLFFFAFLLSLTFQFPCTLFDP